MFLEGVWMEEKSFMIGPWPHFSNRTIPSLEPIRVLVNLTETAYDVHEIDTSIVDILHVPIPDFSTPTPLQFRKLLRHWAFYRFCKLPVYMHCMGGFGRAGTMAACYLMMQGETAAGAIKKVRKLRPGAIETKEQEIFIYSSEEWIPAILQPDDQMFFQAKKCIEILRQKCPWDHKQTHESLIPSLLDESFEVVEAIRKGDSEGLKEELGDLMIQPLIHAQISENEKEFTIYESLHYMIKKLLYRHPHVFASSTPLDAHQVIDQWTFLKRSENTNLPHEPKNDLQTCELLTDVHTISEEASLFGFDWVKAEDIVDKMVEECIEIKDAVQSDHSRKVEQELGDLLFAALNFARYYGVDPVKSLQRGRRKFEIRFRYVQRNILADALDPNQLTTEELNQYWEKAKKDLPEAY
ncbi:MAG: nucleoside triphosphate pyrophosphohydrolase [Caldisericia bacterium]|nr:nucleoside triphosphate pyrophosphohydrolase [Caldisericia bacterium]